MITRYCIEEAARTFRETATSPQEKDNTRVILSCAVVVVVGTSLEATSMLRAKKQ